MSASTLTFPCSVIVCKSFDLSEPLFLLENGTDVYLSPSSLHMLTYYVRKSVETYELLEEPQPLGKLYHLSSPLCYSGYLLGLQARGMQTCEGVRRDLCESVNMSRKIISAKLNVFP